MGFHSKAHTLAQDTIGEDYSPNANEASGRLNVTIPAEGDATLLTRTLTYIAGSLMGMWATLVVGASEINALKARVSMGGVQVYESSYLPNYTASITRVGYYETRALSGSQNCNMTVHNYTAIECRLYAYGGEDSGDPIGGGIFCVSMKI